MNLCLNKMKRKIKIGIVGCGTIGTELAKKICDEFKERAILASLFDKEIEKAFRLQSRLKKKKIVCLNLEDLIGRADLVIETASVESSFEIAKAAISAKKDIFVMSTGGLLEHPEIFSLAKENDCSIFIPSGAVCGIDGIKAANLGKINKVILTTRKPPQAFKGSPFILKNRINLDSIKEETLLFEGKALDAVIAFPQNINVAATLSIAGAGQENTFVRIITSPEYKKNIHEIEIEAESGDIYTRCENLPSPENPKTSYLAILSAIATLKQILEPVKIGT